MTESAANDRDRASDPGDSSEREDFGAGEEPAEGSEALDADMPEFSAQPENEAAQGEDEIVPVQFAQLEEPPQTKAKRRIGRLNNVRVEIIVELGRTEKSVRELTRLKENDVIDLDKLAGEPFDILINRRQFAEGEIVVVTDQMAVRITRLLERPLPREEAEEEEEERSGGGGE